TGEREGLSVVAVASSGRRETHGRDAARLARAPRAEPVEVGVHVPDGDLLVAAAVVVDPVAADLRGPGVHGGGEIVAVTGRGRPPGGQAEAEVLRDQRDPEAILIGVLVATG